MTHLTHHALDRLSERVGLSQKAARRLSEKALNQGIRHAETSGNLKRFVDSLYLAHKNADNIRIYGEFVYLFRDVTLITVVGLPRQFRLPVRKLLQRRGT